MHKVKIALFNAQKIIKNNEVVVFLQKIVGLDFKNDDIENFFSKQEKTKITATPKENQRILWREDLWDSLSEEYVIINSDKAFVILIEEKLEKIGNSKQEMNRFVEIESKDLENVDEHSWHILCADDRKYVVVNERDIQQPMFQVIRGGKK